MMTRIFRFSTVILVVFSFLLLVSSPVLCGGNDYDKVKESFEVFLKQWMKKLYGMEADNYMHLKLSNTGNMFRGEYIGYGLKYDYVVKRTNSAVTPYVGTVTYQQIKYVNTGASKKDILKGPFKIDSVTRVKEIFRYTGGKWLY